MREQKRMLQKRIITLVFVILGAVIFSSFPTPGMITSVEAASKIALNKTKTTLAKGQSLQLSISGTTKTVTWSSEDKSIVTVSSKGKIKAKAVGTTNVVAKVSGKKYYCKVTVKKAGVYDSAIAKQSTSYSFDKVWNGVIMTAKNESGFAEYLTAKMTFYDSSGKKVAVVSEINPYFETGQSSLMFFEIPEGKTYSTYKMSYSYSKPTIKSGNASKVKLTSKKYSTGVLVTAKNNSSLKTTKTKIAIIYYKNGIPIYYADDYATCSKPKSTADVVFFNPVDETLKDVAYDSYKLFVNYSY